MERFSDVLFVGTTYDDGKKLKEKVGRSLRTMRPEFSFNSEVAPTFAAAMGIVPILPRLELVHIANDTLRLPEKTLEQRCTELARLLSQHPNKPWVTFDDKWESDPLVLIFEGPGAPKNPTVRVERGDLTDVICDRWSVQKMREQIHA